MDPTRIAEQMISFQKNMFDTTFNTIVVLQDQAERMTSTLVDQAAWLPPEAKKAIDEWIKSYKKGREDYRKMVYDSFDNMARSFAGTAETGTPKSE